MSSTDISIHLQVFDDASNVIQSFSGNLESAFSEVESKTQELTSSTDNLSTAYSEAASQADEINSSYAGVAQATDQVTMSSGQAVMSLNSLAQSGMMLYMSFNNVTNAGVALDRANVNVQKSTETLQKATEAYNKDLAEYGPNAQQTIDALAKMGTDQDALTVSQERASMAQRNYNNDLILAGLSVIPSVISVMNLLSNSQEIWNGLQTAGTAIAGAFGIATGEEAVANAALGVSFDVAADGSYTLAEGMVGVDAAMDANPIGIIILAIAGLVAGLVAAYTYCKPFRDAINDIGAALGNYLKPALDDVVAALTWLWNNILVPLGNFVAGILIGQFTAVIDVLEKVASVLSPIGDAFNWLAGVIGKAASDISNAINDVNAKQTAMAESAKNGLAVMANYYLDEYNSMTKTVDDALDKQVDSINTKYAAMTTAQNTAYQTDLTNLDDYWNSKYNVTETDLQKTDDVITQFYNKQESDLQTSYNKQVSDTNAFYDQLETANDAGLNAIKALRTADENNLEEQMLVQKTALEDAHAQGLISDTDYQTQISAIDTQYNDSRGVMDDHYQLQELQAQDTASTNSVTIETNRTTALTGLATTNAAAVNTIETQKDADLAAAQTQYNQLSTTNAQALLQIQTDNANAIKDAETLAATQKHDQLMTIENKILQDTTLTETQKKDLIAQLNSEIGTNTTDTWNGVQNAIDGVTGATGGTVSSWASTMHDNVTGAFNDMANVVSGAANSIISSANSITGAVTTVQTGSNTIASISQSTETGFTAVGSYTGTEVSNAPNQQQTVGTVTGPGGVGKVMAAGGVVTEPTIALIGEAGPEAVIPLDQLRLIQKQPSGGNGVGGPQQITNNITISVGNISNEVDLDKVPEKVSEGIAEFYRRQAY